MQISGSIAGSASTSTESRLVCINRRCNGGVSVDFQPQGVISPAVPGEESRWLLRDWRVWCALQSRGVTGGREGVDGATPRVPAGSHTVSGVQTGEPPYFRRKIQRVIGAEVYWNSTVDRVTG